MIPVFRKTSPALMLHRYFVCLISAGANGRAVQRAEKQGHRSLSGLDLYREDNETEWILLGSVREEKNQGNNVHEYK